MKLKDLAPITRNEQPQLVTRVVIYEIHPDEYDVIELGASVAAAYVEQHLDGTPMFSRSQVFTYRRKR